MMGYGVGGFGMFQMEDKTWFLMEPCFKTL
jgi:hypothetical protein